MNARTKLVAMFLVAGGAAVALGERPQDPPPRKGPDGRPETWMIAKLHDAQDVFAGLTRGDFDTINLNARRMLISNLLEQWGRTNDFTKASDYEAQVNAYEFAVKELIRSSVHRDSTAALEAYTRMSTACVNCHQLIRDTAK